LGKKESLKLGKPWECIRHALLNSDNALVVRYTNRGKERLATITTENGEMVMLSLAFASDYSLPDEAPPSIEVTENDIKQASTFVESMKEIDLNSVFDERKSKIEEVAKQGETVTIQTKESNDGMSFFS
jgi:non-homologous end joining protein Ku